MTENKTHRNNYPGTKRMKAENQSMTFVNDTLENAPEVTSLNLQKDDINEKAEDKNIVQNTD